MRSSCRAQPCDGLAHRDPFAVDRAFLGGFAFWEMIAFSIVFFGAFVYVVANGTIFPGDRVRKNRELNCFELIPH